MERRQGNHYYLIYFCCFARVAPGRRSKGTKGCLLYHCVCLYFTFFYFIFYVYVYLTAAKEIKNSRDQNRDHYYSDNWIDKWPYWPSVWIWTLASITDCMDWHTVHLGKIMHYQSLFRIELTDFIERFPCHWL